MRACLITLFYCLQSRIPVFFFSQSGLTASSEWQDAINEATFQDLLATDEEPDRKFTCELFLNFFEQATSTFADMEEAL